MIRRMVSLHTPTVFWLNEGTISPSYIMHIILVLLSRQIHTVEPLVPEPMTLRLSLLLKS
jgi:hypothetical protein